MIDIKEDLFNCVKYNQYKKKCSLYSGPIGVEDIEKRDFESVSGENYKDYIIKKNIETEPKEYNMDYRLMLKIKIDLKKFKNTNKEKQYYQKENDTIVFILMNTSYASEENSDRTINNCIKIAGYNNYSNIEIYNLSPLRTPKPACLNKKLKLECPGITNKTEKEKDEIKKIIDELNEQNKKKLEEVANSNNKTIVVAWGGLKCGKDAKETEYELKTNANYFLEMCKKNGKYKDIKCIIMNQNKSPRHPCHASNNNTNWTKLNQFDNDKEYFKQIEKYLANNKPQK